MKKITLVVLMFIIPISAGSKTAVTYELAPGRFGDNLLSYIHAKWISYKYDIPLLYRPFTYSDQMMMHKLELSYDQQIKQYHKTTRLNHNVAIQKDNGETILYEVPYFPESKYEKEHCKNFEGKPWYYFEIDWNNENFVSLLRSTITPRIPLKKRALPQNRTTVAIHIRRGGNHDTANVPPLFPLKFLPMDFYIDQLKKTYELLGDKPLYVYIFTDDNHPAKLAARFKKKLSSLNIQFDWRKRGNCDKSNVLEDFFAMKEFDCLIHSESNYSFIMSKLGDYLISIYPSSFQKRKGRIIYDTINTKFYRNHRKYRNLIN